MGETEESTRGLANASGFPFQIWLGSYIDQTSEQHGWQVMTSEIRWINQRTGREEFADLVLSHKHLWRFRSVVEVKRVREGVWVFLRPDQSSDKVQRFRAFVCCADTSGTIRARWMDGFRPSGGGDCLVSSYCVVRGQGKERPMLERLASYILLATESIGEREAKLRNDGRLFVFPIVVTNAQLVVHAFDPEQVDPQSGELRESQFAEVPYLLFRKSIGTVYSTGKQPRYLSDLNAQDERDVLIVNSMHVADALGMLSSFNIFNMRDPYWKDCSGLF